MVKFTPTENKKEKLWGRRVFFAISIIIGVFCIIAGFVTAEKTFDNAIYIVGGIVIVLISLIGDTIVILRNNLLETLSNKDDVQQDK